MAESSAINPKQCKFLLSVQISVITVEISVITFWREKTFTGKTNMATKVRQTQGTFRINLK